MSTTGSYRVYYDPLDDQRRQCRPLIETLINHLDAYLLRAYGAIFEAEEALPHLEPPDPILEQLRWAINQTRYHALDARTKLAALYHAHAERVQLAELRASNTRSRIRRLGMKICDDRPFPIALPPPQAPPQPQKQRSAAA